MKRALAIVILLLLALPAAAIAGPSKPGAYVSGFLGFNQTDDATLNTFDVLAPSRDYDLEFDPGIYLGGTGGYDFGIVRLEGELSYRSAEIDEITNVSSGTRFRGSDSSLGTLAVMFNAVVDLENATPVTPYFGAGVGFATLSFDDDNFESNGNPIFYEDTATTGAFQVGAGFEIAINPRFSLDLGYRYFKTGEANFDENWDIENEIELESHNFAVGFRAKF